MLQLIPNPRKIELNVGEVRIPSEVLIWVDPVLSERCHLLDGLRKTMGQAGVDARFCVRQEDAWIQFRLEDELDIDFKALADNFDHVLSHIALQSYRLEIGPQGVIGTAVGGEGLAYAIVTFIQILKQIDLSLPACSIVDFPLYPSRGVMLDVSRGKVPTIESLKELIVLLSEHKINVFQLYVEHTYYFPSHPHIGENSGRLTADQIRDLDSFCEGWGVDLQPNIQTFSHFHQILRLPEYYHLAENDGLWTLAPGKEGSYELLDSMLADFIPAFSSKTVNINMDEAYDIGTGYSQTECEGLGKGQVYLNHILKVYQQVKSLGVETVQLWGEMINKYPELLEQAPDDLIFMDWHYNPDTEYPSLVNFRNSNRSYWVAPGVSSWNSIFPRIENAYINITNLAKQGLANGASGLLLTDWGDYGHYQPLGLSFTGYIFGAEQSWNAGGTDKNAFESALKALCFQNDRQFRVWDLLRQSNLVESLQTGFKTKTIYAFFDDLIRGKSLEGNPAMEPITHETFKEYADITFVAWRESQKLGDTELDLELRLAAWMSYFTAKKGLFSWELRELIGSGELTTKIILDQVSRVKSLYQEFEAIRDLFSLVWDLRARPEGKEISLFYFAKTAVQFYALVKWLNRQRVLISEGKSTEGLDSYQSAEDYTTLWTQDFSNLWDRSYPWN